MQGAKIAKQLFAHALSFSHYQSQSSPEDAILAIIGDILDQLQKAPHLLRFINKNLSWGVFRRAMDRADLNFLPVIQKIYPSLQEETIQITAYTIIELVGATCHSVILDQDPVSLAQYQPYLNRAIRAVLKELTAAPSQTPEDEEGNN